MQNLQQVGKNSRTILSRLWTKVHDILRQYRTPLVVFSTLTNCLRYVLFQRYRPFKLPLSFVVIEKGGFGAPISDIRFQITLTSEHLASFG